MKMIRKTAVCLAAFLLLTLGLGGCQISQEPETRTVFAMDTVITLTAYGENAGKALDAAVQKLNDYDLLLDVDSGDIGAVNENAGEFVGVSEEVYKLLSDCVEFSRQTDGAFDLTVGRYINLWGFRSQTRVPSDEEIAEAAEFVGWEQIELADGKVKIPEGMQLDLGAVAKGFVAGKLKELLTEYGIESAILSLGGNVTTLGEKPDGSQFVVAIRDPNDPDAYLDTVNVSDTAVVTSGSYMRYFDVDGVRYHHIIDPETGKPADSGLVSVTVICTDDTAADAYATAFFVMGAEKTSEFLKDRPEINVIMVETNGEIIRVN
ncbi:MAG TPA: FAD:protein FMN transferase [Oscillospiraceae bacterium]|nr:FAD:protein FMN transferase [Oscillospiraceae bacterium]HPF56604.1 FAD:protein FMN transferase [Clostridiales bacterium]HPK35192.1 FAD:protein FMN transferase [Oscillospiraceae bacterium]HPR74995.1 FAD:protein FMN transferase [Oscillospiraceae bacterium]